MAKLLHTSHDSLCRVVPDRTAAVNVLPGSHRRRS